MSSLSRETITTNTTCPDFDLNTDVSDFLFKLEGPTPVADRETEAWVGQATA